MSRRRLVVVAIAVVVLALVAAFVMSGSRGGGAKRNAGAGRDGTTVRAGVAGALPKRAGLSWAAQRGAAARRVAGRVIFEGRPVAGATVRMISRVHRDAHQATRTTGEDGTFDFGPQEATSVLVSASADGKTGAALALDLRDPEVRPAPDAIVLELRPCIASLYGFVLDASSGPIPGATLRRGPIEAVAAADGAYIMCVPIGDNTLDIGADGYGTITLSLAVTNRLRRDFRLSPEGVVTGRAVRADDGTPVADAIVTMLPSGTGMPGISAAVGGAGGFAVTDGDGRFRLEGVVPGRRQINAAADGLRARTTDVNVIAGDAGEEVTITLEPTTLVQGRVVDEAGKVVAGATLTLSDGERMRGGFDEGSTAVSQPDGSFVLEGIHPGTYSIEIDPFRATSATPHTIEVPAAGLRDLSLVVTRGSTISGLVTRSGKPMGGARVYLQSGGGDQVLSEADGRFALRGILPGMHRIYAENIQVGAFNRGPTVAVVAGQDVTGVTVELALAGSIAGVVVDQHGKPVSGAYLSFQLVAGNDYGEATTAEDGSFETRALSGGGEYRVAIMASRRSSLKFLPVDGDDFPLVAVADGDSHVTGVRYAVTVDRLTISGTVVDEKGQPLPDVRVEASPRGDRGWEMGELPAGVTDTDGAFAITNLLAGDYQLDARAGNGAQSSAPAAAGARDVKITLARPGTIEGTLAGFTKPTRVMARPLDRGRMADGPLNGDVTGATFRVRGVAPGQYVVVAVSGGVIGDEQMVTVASAGTARAALTYRGTGTVKATVVDANKQPIAGAHCSMAGVDDSNRELVSDAQGTFVIEPASVGIASVYCFAEAGHMGSARVTVAAGKTAAVEITMAPYERPKAKVTIGASFVKTAAGPRVSALVADGPAAKAGVQLRDILLEIEGIETSYRDTDAGILEKEIIGRLLPDHPYKFRFRRGSETVEIPIVVTPI